MKKVCCVLLLCLLCPVLVFAEGEKTDTYKCEPLGFSLSRPGLWCGRTGREPAYDCAEYKKADDPRLQAGIQEDEEKTLHMVSFGACGFVFPEVDVWVRFFKPNENLANYKFPRFPDSCASKVGTHENFAPVRPYQEMEIDGQKGGECSARYEVRYGEKLVPVKFEQWVIPRDGYEIRIEASTLKNAPQDIVNEVHSIIESVRVWADPAVIHYVSPEDRQPG